MSTTEQQVRYDETHTDASKSALSVMIPVILGLSIAGIILIGNATLLGLNCAAAALALSALFATFYQSKAHSRSNFSILTILLCIFIVLVILTALWNHTALLTYSCINLAFSFFGMITAWRLAQLADRW